MSVYNITIGERVPVKTFDGVRWGEILFIQGDVALAKDGDGPLSQTVFLFDLKDIASSDETDAAERMSLRVKIRNCCGWITPTTDLDALRQALAILEAATASNVEA